MVGGPAQMQNYKVPLVPGPVSVPQKYREVYLKDFGSSDLEIDFFQLLKENQNLLQQILKTKNSITIQSGEGMLALWGGLKSTLKSGHKVLVISNGLFGRGFGDMAISMGAEIQLLEAHDGEFIDTKLLTEAISSFKPDMVTAVHCETPSGLLNPIEDIAPIIKESGALFVVDFVASAIGADVRVDEWGIDLGLLGSQKCLSLLPDLSILTVSDRAWKVAEKVAYAGYDALLPWKNVLEEEYMPYTHNWHSNAALNVALKSVLKEGLENSFKRHEETAAYCRKRAKEMGLELYVKDEKLASPTVTAIKMPTGMTWKALDSALRKQGVVVGGSYGDLAEKVFRIGHMGSQADMFLVKSGMDVLEQIIKRSL